MGIYLFNRAKLVEIAHRGHATDFGNEIFPQAIAEHRVQAHLFDGYWEDIGTIGAFHKANIDLTLRRPAVRLHLRRPPDLHPPALPPCSRLPGVTINNSLIADGCVIGRGR